MAIFAGSKIEDYEKVLFVFAACAGVHDPACG